MEIRAYTAKDLPGMRDVWNEVVLSGDAFPQENELSIAEAEDFFASQTFCGVADDGKGIVGLYILHPNNVGRCGHISNASYAVKKTERGKGIGELLVKDCLRAAKEHGFRILQFNAVVRSNLPALNLYEKLGFTRLGIIKGGFKNKDGTYEDIVPHYIEL